MPDISDAFMDRLDRAFAPIDYTPNVTTIEDVAFSAGARKVIEWIAANRRTSIVTGGALDP